MKKILMLALAILLLGQIYQNYLMRQTVLNRYIETQKMKAGFIAHHIEEYFTNIKDELTLISRLDGVKAMDKAVENIVWKIAISKIEKDWFTEIYISSKDQDGFHQPNMVFELEGGKLNMTKDEYHALERELDEYAVISNWRDTFSKHKSDFLISKELNLCVDYRGFVGSVPIYKDDVFVGQVSAMFSKKQLFNIINRDSPSDSMALLIDNDGNFIMQEPVEAYSESPEKIFPFNPDPDRNIKELKNSPSFKKIAQDMVLGGRGYSNFEFGSGKKSGVFIYYLPIEWDKNRWSLGVITPRIKMAEEQKVGEMIKYQLLFALNILSVLFISWFALKEESKSQPSS